MILDLHRQGLTVSTIARELGIVWKTVRKCIAPGLEPPVYGPRKPRRGSAVDSVIGHLKSEHRMGRKYLWHRQGDAANAVLAAAGYNFRRLIKWLSLLLFEILAGLSLGPQLIAA